jgi:hypothetical protein
MTSYRTVCRYQGFGGSCCLHLQGSPRSVLRAISQKTGGFILAAVRNSGPYNQRSPCNAIIVLPHTPPPPPPTIISTVTSRYRNRTPECCLVAAERQPIRKKSQRILVFLKLGAPHKHYEACGGFIYATGESLISVK